MNPPRTDLSVPCPVCKGPIRYTLTLPHQPSPKISGLTVTVVLNQIDALRHARCFTPPTDDGEPLPVPLAA